MLLDNINGGDDELIAQHAAADREWTYGHIVVDEAQELTAMDWRMLIRRCPSRSFTIVGDVAQTSALGGTRSWAKTMDRLFGPDHWDLNELTIDYRNPQEVSDLASEFAQREGLYVSTVKAVRHVDDSVRRVLVHTDAELNADVASRTLSLVKEFISDDGTGRIAVICSPERLPAMQSTVDDTLRDGLPEDRYKRLAEQSSWDRQVMVCTTEEVKGLEFDAVIVVEPGEIEQTAPSRLVAAADLYVAMTRPTQRLLIVRTEDDEHQLMI